MDGENNSTRGRWPEVLAALVLFAFFVAMHIGRATQNGAAPIKATDILELAPFAAALIGFLVMYSRALMRNALTRAIGGLSAMLAMGWLAAICIAALVWPPAKSAMAPSWTSPEISDRIAYIVDALLFWPGPAILLTAFAILFIADAVSRDRFGVREDAT